MSRPLNNSLVIKKIFLSPVCNYTLLWWELPPEFHTQRWRPGCWAATTTPKESRANTATDSATPCSHPRAAESSRGFGQAWERCFLLYCPRSWSGDTEVKVPDVSLERSDPTGGISDRLEWPAWTWHWSLFVWLEQKCKEAEEEKMKPPTFLQAAAIFTSPQAPESAAGFTVRIARKPGAFGSGGLGWPEYLSF